jgi:hypothetical protein
MAFRIKAKDLIVEVDTQEEFLIALRVMSNLDEKPVASVAPGKTFSPFPPKSIGLGLSVELSKEDRLVRLYEDIRSEQRRGMLEVVKTLANAGDWLFTEKLKGNLTIEATALGGTLGAISKRAKKLGLKREDVLLREVTKEGIRLRLSSAMKEVVRSESAKEQPM